MSKLNRIAKTILLRRWTYAGWLVFLLIIIAPILYVLLSSDEWSWTEVAVALAPGIVVFLIMWSLGRFRREKKK